jgi:hypothetical protein
VNETVVSGGLAIAREFARLLGVALLYGIKADLAVGYLLVPVSNSMPGAA